MARMARDEEEFDDDVQGVGEGFPPGEPETVGEKLVARTPWWAISIGMHAMVALIVGFFWVVAAIAEETVVELLPPRPPRVIPAMKKKVTIDPKKKLLDMNTSVTDPVYKKAIKSDHTETADEVFPETVYASSRSSVSSIASFATETPIDLLPGETKVLVNIRKYMGFETPLEERESLRYVVTASALKDRKLPHREPTERGK